MLNKFKIEEVEKISEEQENLNKKFHSKLNMKIIIYSKYIIQKIQINILC